MHLPILILADIHGNLEALKAVLFQVIGDYRALWVLGDIVGYGPDPSACLHLLQAQQFLGVAGNHDRAVLGDLDINQFNAEAKQALLLHRRTLSSQDKAALASLPTSLIRQSVTLSHASPKDPLWGYIFSDHDAADVLAQTSSSLTLVGHSHIPALWTYDKDRGARSLPLCYDQEISYAGCPHLANPGSVGQSRNGDLSAHYLLLNPERKTLFFKRCSWKSKATRRKMIKQGYPLGLIDRMAP